VLAVHVSAIPVHAPVIQHARELYYGRSIRQHGCASSYTCARHMEWW
jgi:hypothetical protein